MHCYLFSLLLTFNVPLHFIISSPNTDAKLYIYYLFINLYYSAFIFTFKDGNLSINVTDVIFYNTGLMYYFSSHKNSSMT